MDLELIKAHSFVGELPTQDTIGHGTECASVLAGLTSAKGEAIVVPLLVGQVIGSSTTGDTHALANGVSWAVENQANLIVIPSGSLSASLDLERAIDEAAESRAIIIAPVGNDAESLVNPLYPAFMPCVLAVGVSRHRQYYRQWSRNPDVVISDRSIRGSRDGTVWEPVYGSSFAAMLVARVVLATTALYGFPETRQEVLDRVINSSPFSNSSMESKSTRSDDSRVDLIIGQNTNSKLSR